MAEPRLRADAEFTYGDYARCPEGERWELIDGIAYDMTPAPGTIHQELLGRLFRQFAVFLDGKPCRVFLSPLDLLLPEADEPDAQVRTVVQPDLLVVCDRSKVSKKGVRGAPDLIIEILSPSTARNDQVTKFHLYEKHGVREYWIVHPEGRFVTIYLLGEDRRYGRPIQREADGLQPVHVLPDLEINLESLFADLD